MIFVINKNLALKMLTKLIYVLKNTIQRKLFLCEKINPYCFKLLNIQFSVFCRKPSYFTQKLISDRWILGRQLIVSVIIIFQSVFNNVKFKSVVIVISIEINYLKQRKNNLCFNIFEWKIAICIKLSIKVGTVDEYWRWMQMNIGN